MGIRHERCRMSTTVALRGHSNRVAECPLLGVKRTSQIVRIRRGHDKITILMTRPTRPGDAR